MTKTSFALGVGPPDNYYHKELTSLSLKKKKSEFNKINRKLVDFISISDHRESFDRIQNERTMN